jgi:hypothetical protein
MRRPNGSAPSVFINCPFDPSYERLFVALVGSLMALGLAPRSVLEVQGTTERPFVHRGTPVGMIQAIANLFSKPGEPSIRQLLRLFRSLEVVAHEIKSRERYASLFAARPFRQLVFAANRLAVEQLG